MCDSFEFIESLLSTISFNIRCIVTYRVPLSSSVKQCFIIFHFIFRKITGRVLLVIGDFNKKIVKYLPIIIRYH